MLPVTGLTPAESMSVDAVMLLGCGVALVGEVLAGAAVLWLPVLLWTLGCIGASVHAFAIRTGSIDDARIGATWSAAMAAGLAAMHVCRDERIKRVTLAAAVGLIVMLAAKGAVQVFHEHAMTVARYNQDRESFLAAQGWTPDSASARNFERRLNQPEATGWFGLANVYATFAAACMTALYACAVLGWREARILRRIPDGWAGLLTIGALVACGALVLAGSKGGAAAAVLGLGLISGVVVLTRKRKLARVSTRAAGMIAVTIVVGTVLAVVARGLLGEHLGDRSLLFRWYYMEGATRAFAEAPLFGTGPDGFKDAYMRLKPALSPEEVSSPHSVFFDFAARLGVFGVLWAALWMRWVYGLGGVALAKPAASVDSPRGVRTEGWIVFAAAVAPVLVSTWVERALGSPEQAAARLAGLAGWVGVSIAVLTLLRVSRAATSVFAIAALVAAVHGQIEVTPLWDSSAAWMCMVLGAAGAGGVIPARRANRAMVAPGLLVGAAVGVAWLGVAPTSLWQLALSEAADQMRPMAEFRTRLDEVTSGRKVWMPGDSMPNIASDLARATGTAPATNDGELNRALVQLSFRVTSEASSSLYRAVELAQGHFATREALIRVLMERSAAASAMGLAAESETAAQAALNQATELVRRRPSASSWGLLGNIEAAEHAATRDPRHLDRAIEAWEAGAKLDPHGLSLPLQAFKAMIAAGRMEAAREVAKTLLRLDSLQRLDELKRLSPADRAAVESSANGT